MRKRRDKEEKIKKSFDTFFSDFKEKTWRPSDFKQYKRSIYKILCSSYKNTENKIDRKYIVENFVPEEERSKFKHTNIYNREWIITTFKQFFASQKEKWKDTRNISELEKWNESLVITLSRKYGYQNKQRVNREVCVEEHDLDGLGCVFKRNAPLRTPITMERVNEELHEIINGNNWWKWSPDSLFRKKPQYLKRLGKKYRDERWKIDWLYILYKVFDDTTIVDAFKHRYTYDRLLDLPTKTKESIQIDQNYGRKDNDALNPEELYIQNEENEVKQWLTNRIYESIEKKLSNQEKEILFSFLEWNQSHKIEVEKIILKLKEDMENQ